MPCPPRLGFPPPRKAITIWYDSIIMKRNSHEAEEKLRQEAELARQVAAGSPTSPTSPSPTSPTSPASRGIDIALDLDKNLCLRFQK